MILLKISNASDLVASKLGSLIERLTPDGIDNATVEEILIEKMIENFVSEGLKGEIVTANGIDFDGDKLILEEGFKVRNNKSF